MLTNNLFISTQRNEWKNSVDSFPVSCMDISAVRVLIIFRLKYSEI